MVKRITNVVLLLISIGIILFIVHAFYSVFTREPQSQQTEENTTNESTVSGQIVGAGQTANTSVENAFADTSSPLPGAPGSKSAEDEASNEESAPASDEEANSASATADDSTSANSSQEGNTTNNSTSEDLLNKNPKLRNALPPVPVAPPSATPTTDNHTFPSPIAETNNSFPAPATTPSNNSFPAPSSNFPTPATAPSNNSFPAPSGNFPAPSSSFPAPSGNLANPGTNNNFPAPE